MASIWDKKRSLPILILIGFVLAFFIVSLKQPLERELIKEVGRSVSVIEAKSRSVVPTAVGYGTVRPATEIQLSAEVAGRITYIHPKLKEGESLPANTLILKIDKTDYELRLSKSKSQLQQAKTQLREFAIEEDNIKQSIQLVAGKVELAQKELERKRTLLDRKLVSQSAIDREEQSLLALKQEKQNLTRELDVMPQRIETQKAEIDRAKAQVREAEHDLERTRIYMPIRARIAQVSTEINQYIARGGLLVKLQGVSQMEVATRLTLQQMRPLVLGVFRGNYVELAQFPDVSSLPQMKANVALAEKSFDVSWEGVVTRVGSELNSKTRTLDVVVTIAEANTNMVPGVKPPLMRGMYMRVNVSAPPLTAFVVPRYALHENKLFLLDEEKRLVKREVKVDFYTGELAVIREGLNAGELVVLTDLVPAVEGTQYKPRVSQEVENWVEVIASGGEPQE